MDTLPKAGTEVYIQSYKHDGSLHRTWCKGFVLSADENQIVAVTNKAWVIESNGRRWFTREPAVCFFWAHRWFNVISMIRKTGVYYYCNLASPSLYDGEAIKNIDYDLDVKLYPDRSYQILDENEYAAHAKEMHYPKEVMEIVEREMQQLLGMMEREEDPFNEACIYRYYQQYQEMNQNNGRVE
ncbi:MAG: DUF402 domain-containing protein [Solobacterium sp.]|jgi:protein associated with RNAse G/E|nr:DUF402 domain-containing protein [Solobacterium sp.]MCH4223310.1 DUF402 domain-containing protein [Solobacterium sp.]